MVNSAIEKELFEHLNLMPIQQQRELLSFARSLAAHSLKSEMVDELFKFADQIATSELATISMAIEEDCRKHAANEKTTRPDQSIEK